MERLSSCTQSRMCEWPVKFKWESCFSLRKDYVSAESGEDRQTAKDEYGRVRVDGTDGVENSWP